MSTVYLASQQAAKPWSQQLSENALLYGVDNKASLSN